MQPVKSVIIVGAGSAGWLTALALNTYCRFLKIRLVRPRKGSPIGVGESTQADFLSLLQAARIDVPTFYKACDASMKCGIFYEDWNALGEHYWHPFSGLAQTGAYTAAHHYQQMILEDTAQFSHASYYASVHTSYRTCVEKKQVAPEAAIAFHVDATKIAEFLERELPGVEVLEADNVDVQSAEGKITGIVLDSNVVSADLYVDCTGFSRVLFERVASPEVMPYEADVNRVVTAQIPYVETEKEFTPYTRAHAHEHGWTWSIPLQSRIGSGYVYHDDFCSPEQAERNFRAYLGMERMRGVEVRHIAFDSVTLRNPWIENVVAIGLSAGFVEPLEATGLSWIIMSADTLCRSLAGSHAFDKDTSIKYNANMLGYVHDVHDFIDAHYKLSSRRDSDFWRYQASRTYPERLELRLETYAAEMPNHINRAKTGPWAFNEVSWIDILNGYRFEYAKLHVDPMQRALAQKALQQIAASPRRGLDPRTCVPERPQDPRLQSIG